MEKSETAGQQGELRSSWPGGSPASSGGRRPLCERARGAGTLRLSLCAALVVAATAFAEARTGGTPPTWTRSIPESQQETVASEQSDGESEKPAAKKVPGFEQGLEVALQVQKELGLVESLELESRVARIGYRVAAGTGETTIPYSFRVVKMDEPNAFALPGGFVFVTEGMTKLDLTDDELAHLIGHELAHARLEHSAKLQRRAYLMDVLHQVVLAGLILGAKNMTSEVGQYGNARPGSAEAMMAESAGPTYSGKAALIQGTAVFGAVLRELLQRGFSRDMEVEADAAGWRYAVTAGYSPAGGADMMRRLRDRVYEWPGATWWRTHPGFSERIGAAEARTTTLAKDLPKRPEHAAPPADRSTEIQEKLEALAQVQRSDEARRFLQESALLANPSAPSAAPIHKTILRERTEAEEQKAPLLRDYRGLIDGYARASELLAPHAEVKGTVAELDRERARLTDELTRLRPSFSAALGHQGGDTRILESFVKSYPEDPAAPEMTFRLGEHLRLSGQDETAAETYLKLLAPGSSSEWSEKGRRRLAHMLTIVSDPKICFSILNGASDAELTKLAHDRLAIIVKTFSELTVGKRFVMSCTDPASVALAQQRLKSLGQRVYNQGRQLEAIGDPQSALERYHEVLDAVPDGDIVELARRRIEQLRSEDGAGS
ncbi:MAG: M48 family metalloprotease [Candidatus Schekmanbacteria bacterium]|nr:M48 family metalloprotease [Candidatus Schekmanbacteria bacterium]